MKRLTDEELKQLPENEFFDYLDALSKVLSENKKSLPTFMVKKYTYGTAAIQGQKVGTDTAFKDVSYGRCIEIGKKLKTN
jgi:hypothetical protein